MAPCDGRNTSSDISNIAGSRRLAQVKRRSFFLLLQRTVSWRQMHCCWLTCLASLEASFTVARHRTPIFVPATRSRCNSREGATCLFVTVIATPPWFSLFRKILASVFSPNFPSDHWRWSYSSRLLGLAVWIQPSIGRSCAAVGSSTVGQSYPIEYWAPSGIFGIT